MEFLVKDDLSFLKETMLVILSQHMTKISKVDIKIVPHFPIITLTTSMMNKTITIKK